MKQLIVSPDTATRLALAAQWLERVTAAGSPVLVIAPSWEAADELARHHVRRVGASCGLQRATLDRLALRLALPLLAMRLHVPASRLALQAVVARTVFLLRSEGALRYFSPVADRPGFTPATAETLEELRMQGLTAAEVPRPTPGADDVARIAARFEAELSEAGLADRALIYRAAVEAVCDLDPVPLLLLDVSIRSSLEQKLVAALAARASHPSPGPGEVYACLPCGDERSEALLVEALGVAPEVVEPAATDALCRLKRHLFVDSAPGEARLDASLDICSWPGEARECVEIARSLQKEAAEGTPFDRMAVLLRAPLAYRAYLEEALSRAGIPAWFAGGTARPHPSGRALLALLACAAERLSARRFAEYLSLGQVPDAAPDALPLGEPVGRGDSGTAWRPPRHDLAPRLAEDVPPEPPPAAPVPDPEQMAVIGGSLRAPWRWEQLLVDAAVIGGKERWAHRLRGLREQLQRHRALLDGKEEGRVALIDRQLADLSHLESFALPLVGRLAALPVHACWGEWLPALRSLAGCALRSPAAVLEILAELEPMSPVGPLDLDEVMVVLAERLQEVSLPPPRRRYGAVFVAPAEAARGLAFDVVFVPGLVEKVFPQPVGEDAILLDEVRRMMRAARPDARLDLQDDRAARERLALRLAAGAARRKLVLSYPRLDVESGRPRVPSFYALETLRAAEGRLPGFESIQARASQQTAASRLGWPAPQRCEDAIDEAEYDLALIAPLLSMSPEETVGTASYLLGANPHLKRALRFRARRWNRHWSRADGLVLCAGNSKPEEVAADELARAALAMHRIAARAYSPTALQNYAVCPYRFFLSAVQKLQPREEMVAPEVLDPLTRGSLFHEVLFELLSGLQKEGRLPMVPDDLEAIVSRLDETLLQVEGRFRDQLAPAIDRVWDDGIATVRADLRECVRRATCEHDGWLPFRFELSFGLVAGDRGQEDSHSVRDPVSLPGGLRLRGSIDLVERSPDGWLRATDYKTGKARGKKDLVVQGGEVLQPLLYALACESLGRDPVAGLEGGVHGGRLYYCTADGGYQERVVALTDGTRAAIGRVISTIDEALDRGFLPSAPGPDACRYCDYRTVCGPRENERVSRKPKDDLRSLAALRDMP